MAITAADTTVKNSGAEDPFLSESLESLNLALVLSVRAEMHGLTVSRAT